MLDFSESAASEEEVADMQEVGSSNPCKVGNLQ